MTLPKEVTIVEVGPRDGLQAESKTLSIEDRVAFIDLLTQAGLRHIEVGSFVSPTWLPQLEDSGEVYDRIQKMKGVDYSLLVPNLHGYTDAVGHEVSSIAVFTTASETFCQKNINMSIEESLSVFSHFLKDAKAREMRVRGYVSCVFACPYEGPVSQAKARTVVERLFDMGCDEVSLGDTIGRGTPKQVKAFLDELTPHKDRLAVHFHDTYGQALTNIYAALEEGISTVDSSTSGLGGCPYAPGAAGNVATEDVLYLLRGLGIETHVDLDKILEAAAFIDEKLGRVTTSKASKALRGRRERVFLFDNE